MSTIICIKPFSIIPMDIMLILIIISCHKPASAPTAAAAAITRVSVCERLLLTAARTAEQMIFPKAVAKINAATKTGRNGMSRITNVPANPKTAAIAPPII